MPKNVSRSTFDSLLPEGSLWVPKPDGDFDKLLDGISDNSEDTAEFLALLAFIRDCKKTPVFTDLEKEYGLERNDRLTLQERIDRLCAAKTASSGFGADYMQDKLQEAGFDVLVHINNPPVDPGQFLNIPLNAYFGYETSFFGNENAMFSGAGSGGTIGELVVNQDFFIITPNITTQFGSTGGMFGAETGMFGYLDELTRSKVEYTIPADPGYWGLVFFVGGAATRNGTTGELEEIDPAEVSVARREELIRLIIKYKPTHSWCGLIVNFV